jgi:methionyl-tRNA formyltransferase
MDRVVIFADHTIGYNLVEYLLQSEKSDKSFKIVGVFSNNTKDAWWPSISKLMANDKSKFNYFDKTSIKIIKELRPDYLLLLSWKYKLTVELLSTIKINTINIHYSLLPKHRGVYPVNWAIQNGDSETGVSIHLVNQEIDAGKIIAQKIISIDITDNSKTLLEKLDKVSFELFPEIWARRSFWNKIAKDQSGISSYHSKADFVSSNQIDLNKETRPLDFINYLRAKSFGDITNSFFVDPVSKKRFYVNINIEEAG